MNEQERRHHATLQVKKRIAEATIRETRTYLESGKCPKSKRAMYEQNIISATKHLEMLNAGDTSQFVEAR